tara:strand:- start:430 stop:546 length:117 start_codon:yes stop_codon:yes gene_type:complete
MIKKMLNYISTYFKNLKKKKEIKQKIKDIEKDDPFIYR